MCFPLADVVHANTESERWYDLLHLTVLAKDHVIFSVQACKEAHVVLSEIPGVTFYNAYEIAIGVADNKESLIRHNRGGPTLVTAPTDNILNCDEQRQFWISWPGLHSIELEVGHGDIVGQEKFMGTSLETSFLLNSLSVSSGDTETGKWEFHNMNDGRYKLKQYSTSIPA